MPLYGGNALRTRTADVDDGTAAHTRIPGTKLRCSHINWVFESRHAVILHVGYPKSHAFERVKCDHLGGVGSVACDIDFVALSFYVARSIARLVHVTIPTSAAAAAAAAAESLLRW